MTRNTLQISLDHVKNNWSVLLILSALFLFSTKTLFNIPMTIMAVLGIYRLVKNPALLKTPQIKLSCMLFACLWVPMLLSLVDAEEIFRSSKTVFSYVRYIFTGIYIMDELRSSKTLEKVFFGVFILLTFFCLDAMIQFFTGQNLFGYPKVPYTLGGMFYPKNTLSHFLALLSPVYFEYLRQHKHKIWAYLCFLLYLSVLLLGGKRSAWIMFLSGGILYATYIMFISKSVEWKKILVPAALTILVLTSLSMNYAPLKKRLVITSGLFSGDFETIDKATSRRLPIWETGLTIVKSHWLNGVGVRGFRHVYADFTSVDNLYAINGHSGPTHPHLTILEILIETGSIGLIGYLLFWFILAKHARFLLLSNNVLGMCWLISAMLATLPYNAHLAFYGSYWASALWWVIPIFVSCVHYQNKPPE